MARRAPLHFYPSLAACLLASSCFGVAESNTGGPSTQPAAPSAKEFGPPQSPATGSAVEIPAVEACQDFRDPGPSPLRRLTRREYLATVGDLLKVQVPASVQIPADSTTRGFDNNASVQSVSESQAEAYLLAAETLSEQVNLRTLVPCSGTSPNDACAKQFIADFGFRAYRRPLEQAEKDRLFAIFQAGVSQGPGFDSGLKFALQALLQAPAFLYRVELDPPRSTDLVRVGPYFLASRLSYFFTGSMPDDELFRAARDGELETPEGFRAQAERLMKSSGAKTQVASFHRQWLGLGDLDALQKVEPGWSTLKTSLQKETELFAEAAFWNDRNLLKLHDADYTFVNAELAGFYQLTAPTTAGFSKVALTSQRRGLVTHGALLAKSAHTTATSPTHRGLLIRQVFLCKDLPPPPPGVAATVPEVSATATTRERYAAHQSDPSCSGCHALMDPIGLGLEHYDQVGRWRSTEAGKPVDASGELMGAGASSGTFVGGVELAQKLAQSEVASECLTRQWFRFAFGRLETERDACTLSRIGHHLKDNNHDPLELLLALSESEAFLYRAGAPGAAP